MSSDTARDQELTVRFKFRELGAAKPWVSRFVVSSTIRMTTGLSEGRETHLSAKGRVGILRDLLRAKLPPGVTQCDEFGVYG